MDNLENIREEIDKLDERLVKLFNKRAALGRKIARVKETENKPVFYPGREKEILAHVVSLNTGPLGDGALQNIFREIFSATRSVEKKITVASLGPAGTFSHAAALKTFGASAKHRFEKNIAGVFGAVERGSAEFGVAPIENSLEGGVGQTLDLLMDSAVTIFAEQYLPIHHHLLSHQTDLTKVKKLYTHYMPLAQSRIWIGNNIGGATVVETQSTGEAVKRAAREKTAAAIGSAEASQIYHLPMAASGIEDDPRNETRFFVISQSPSPKSSADKTSLALIAKDSPGALFAILRPFESRKINLTRIESRPLKSGAWEYAFYIDLLGHQSDRAVRAAIEKIRGEAQAVKVLGSYPNLRG